MRSISDWGGGGRCCRLHPELASAFVGAVRAVQTLLRHRVVRCSAGQLSSNSCARDHSLVCRGIQLR